MIFMLLRPHFGGTILLAATLSPLSLWGCAGKQATSKTADTADLEDSAETSAIALSDDPMAGVSASGDRSSDGGAAPTQAPPCAGESCSRCGQAACLAGFFCEEASSACSWLPNCAQDLSCSCLQAEMPNCDCEERDGDVFVNCRP